MFSGGGGLCANPNARISASGALTFGYTEDFNDYGA